MTTTEAFTFSYGIRMHFDTGGLVQSSSASNSLARTFSVEYEYTALSKICANATLLFQNVYVWFKTFTLWFTVETISEPIPRKFNPKFDGHCSNILSCLAWGWTPTCIHFVTLTVTFSLFGAAAIKKKNIYSDTYSCLSPCGIMAWPYSELNVFKGLPVNGILLHLIATAEVKITAFLLSLPPVRLAVCAAVRGNVREWKDALIGCLCIAVLHWYSAHRKCWVQRFFQPPMAFLLHVPSLLVRAVICNATQSSINNFLFTYKECPSPFILIGSVHAPYCCVQLSLFNTARNCTGVAEHHPVADVLKCSWFELWECGMKGLIGRFPAVSVWVYWCCFTIAQIVRSSHL